MNNVWVYPGDTLMDMVKALLLTYRQALHDRDPDMCERIDTHALQNPRLEAFIPTQAPFNKDELITDLDAAHLAELSPITIRRWASEGKIQRYCADDGGRRYKLGEIFDVKQQQRHARAKRAG